MRKIRPQRRACESTVENTMRRLATAAAGLITLPVAMAPDAFGAHPDVVGHHADASRAAPTAGDIADPAVVRFRILDAEGRPTAGRLTFIGADGGRPSLFPNVDADPDDLAVRRNVIYSLSGEGAITVPAGRYTLLASKGLEYGIATRELMLEAGDVARFEPRLAREIDTSGWISGDFHLHTLTYSGHGDSNLPERVISLIGEGVEFAVATDHNHNTDYAPTMRELGAERRLTAVVGNEVSTPVGHFNAFPLDPGARVIPSRAMSARPLFAIIRSERNAFGITPIIQLNHPRWSGIDYFTQAGLDPITGESASERYSSDFDTIEIFNENEGWGYFDPAETAWNTDSNTHSVLRDWFNLLNQGHRYAAVGNSDSHHVESEMAGYPRNYMPSPTDDPGMIDPVDVAAKLRGRQVFTTIGPFVEYALNGVPMGGQTRARDGLAELAIRVQAASWVDCDRVKIVVNGDVVDVIDVGQSTDRVRLDVVYPLRLEHDSWVSLLVEGDDPLAPVVHDQDRPILPLAVLNPVWVDVDGDGAWTSPRERARERVAGAFELSRLLPEIARQRPAERAMLALEIVDKPGADRLIMALLDDEDRGVRLAAARGAERLAKAGLRRAIRAAIRDAGDDRFRVALVRALHACGETDIGPLVASMVEAGLDARYLTELHHLFSGAFVTSFRAVGVFPNPGRDRFADTPFGPETDPGDTSYAGVRSGSPSWVPIRSDERGFVDLRALSAQDSQDAVAYAACLLVSPDAREALFTFGSDDGAVVWLNGERLYVDARAHGADPLQHVGVLRLAPGENRLLIKVGNGGGDFGFYFRVLDADVAATVGG